MYLSDFTIIDPPHSYPQEEALKWTLKLHCEAEDKKDGKFKEDLERLIQIVCCKKERIHSRYFVSGDFCINKGLADFGQRAAFFSKTTCEVFENFFPNGSEAPDDLIHVTCTGYNAPSSAQRLVIKRGWKETLVTHAYHMGCMGAIPAIRMACGYAAFGRKKIDVVHTELCSLHFNPSLHSPEQLVAQSLFADGYIKYSVTQNEKPGFQVIAVDEELIPNTEDKMKWECESWGMKMALSKEIPRLISDHLPSFLQKLEKKSKLILKDAFYAIHPGGPKIIDMLRDKLSLQQKQIKASEKILATRGNISSATLPTIWNELFHDPSCPDGSIIVGFAFGPGLCTCGIVLKKKAV